MFRAVDADTPSDARLSAYSDNGRDLTLYLALIWQNFFAELPRVNHVEIAYGRPWKSRLGLIRLSLDHTTTFIGINALLQHQQVPEYVLITTIAHELVHYAHGFGSPLPRRYEHPHAHQIVEHELIQRELGTLLQCCNQWIEQEWSAFYAYQRHCSWAELPARTTRHTPAQTAHC